MSEPTKEQVYDSEINPLMARIIAICKRAGISCFCTFDISPGGDDPDNPFLCTTCLADETGALSESVRRAHDAVMERPRLMASTIKKTGGDR